MKNDIETEPMSHFSLILFPHFLGNQLAALCDTLIQSFYCCQYIVHALSNILDIVSAFR